jgi:hypothetical protein
LSEEFNSFELGSGLLERYRGTIEDAVFVWDETYGRTVLALTNKTDDDDVPEDNPKYGVGGGYEPGSQGLTVQREDGRTKNFNRNSGIGKLISSAIDAGALDALMAKHGQAGAFHADSWIGLDCTFERKTYSFDKKAEGDDEEENNTYTTLIITEFHGVKGDGAKAAPAKAAASTNGGVSAKVKAKLKAIAKDSADFDTFQERAFEEVDEAEDEAVAALIEDEAGIWAEVNA